MKMGNFIIDRFEGDFAILQNENLKSVVVPRSSVSEKAKETDVVIFDGYRFIKDESATASRKKEINELFESLKKE